MEWLLALIALIQVGMWLAIQAIYQKVLNLEDAIAKLNHSPWEDDRNAKRDL